MKEPFSEDLEYGKSICHNTGRSKRIHDLLRRLSVYRNKKLLQQRAIALERTAKYRLGKNPLSREYRRKQTARCDSGVVLGTILSLLKLNTSFKYQLFINNFIYLGTPTGNTVLHFIYYVLGHGLISTTDMHSNAV